MPEQVAQIEIVSRAREMHAGPVVIETCVGDLSEDARNIQATQLQTILSFSQMEALYNSNITESW